MSAPPQPSAAPRNHRRRAVLFVAFTTVIALIAAGIYLGLRSEQYEASVDVLVAPLASDDPEFRGLPLIRESSDGSRPVQTAAGLLSGTAIAQQTAAALDDDWTVQEVESAVGVAPRGQSNLVAITAQTGDAEEAADVANRYAQTALEFRRRSLEAALDREILVVESEGGGEATLQRLRDARDNGDPTLSISSEARPPTGSSLPSTQVVLLGALIAGLLVGLAGVVIADVARVSPDRPQPTA